MVIIFAALMLLTVDASAQSAQDGMELFSAELSNAGNLPKACSALLNCIGNPKNPWCDLHRPADETSVRGISYCQGFMEAAMAAFPSQLAARVG
jgi:hypothetical protein